MLWAVKSYNIAQMEFSTTTTYEVIALGCSLQAGYKWREAGNRASWKSDAFS